MAKIPNPFVYDVSQYNRNIDPLTHWMDDQVANLVIMEGMTKEEAKAFVIKLISPGGEFEFQDPEVAFLERDFDTGDRSIQTSTMSAYLGEIIKCKDIVAPTFTTYHPPSVRKSLLVGFQQGNLIKRKSAKGLMFKAEMNKNSIEKKIDEKKEVEGVDKDVILSTLTSAEWTAIRVKLAAATFEYNFKKSEQTGRKLSNNAVSGSHCNAHNPLFNRTAHSTLTSNCRQTAGYGNTNNERFLAGNRHYWCYAITRNNIISIVNHTNYENLEKVMTMYNLHYPTPDEMMKVITYSTMLYWRDPDSIVKLEKLVMRLTPLQRAAFVYTGDMYHLREYNPEFVREFLRRLIQYVDVPDQTPDDTIHSVPEAFVGLAAQVCAMFMKGVKIDDIKGTKEHGILATVSKNVAMVLLEYSPLVQTFWATNNLPASVAVLPESVRRVVLASDTDSTIFTVQDWVEWYCDGIKFNYEADCVASAMIFLTSQGIIHVLGTMSANAGVERDRTFQISMKNEFKFDIFVLTQLGKHYFAQISIQEGNILGKYKTEIKGVHLKSSNVPKEIVKQAEAMMVSIMNQIRRGEQVSALEKLTEVANLERSVLGSIKRGEFKYLKLTNIKVAEAYKQGVLASNYLQYSLWNDVFGPRFGKVGAPPYRAIVVSVDLDSKAKINNWIHSLKDEVMAANMSKWLANNNKDSLSTMMLPATIVADKGIPDEILEAMNVRKIVHKASAIFYNIIETLGYYTNHTDLKHLAMDYY